jgi:hypothetical protein
VTYRDARGVDDIICDYIVGVAATAVSAGFNPARRPDQLDHEFGYAWLAALVEARWPDPRSWGSG